MTDLPDDITRRLPEEDRIRERIRERREEGRSDDPDDDATVSGSFKFGDDLGVKTGDIVGDLGVKTGDIVGDVSVKTGAIVDSDDGSDLAVKHNDAFTEPDAEGYLKIEEIEGESQQVTEADPRAFKVEVTGVAAEPDPDGFKLDIDGITPDPDAILTTNENITEWKVDAVVDDITTIDQKVVDHKAEDLKADGLKADGLKADGVKTGDDPIDDGMATVKGGTVMINVADEQPSDPVGDALAPLDDASGGAVLVGDEIVDEFTDPVDDGGFGLDGA